MDGMSGGGRATERGLQDRIGWDEEVPISKSKATSKEHDNERVRTGYRAGCFRTLVLS